MRDLRTLGLTAVLGLAVAGCGNTLDASSSCTDFMNASQSAQDEAVSTVATEKGAQSAVTPLGRPNINYLCAGHPEWTLGEVVERTG